MKSQRMKTSGRRMMMRERLKEEDVQSEASWLF